MKPQTVVVITNIPNPYRIPLFNEVNRQLKEKGFHFKVIFAAKGYSRRKFNIDLDSCEFEFAFLDSSSYSFGNSERTGFSYSSLGKVLKKFNADIIIVSGFSIATVKLWLFSFIRKISYIIWSGSIHKKGRFDSLLRKIQRRFLVSRSKAFITYGTEAKNYLVKMGAEPSKIFTAINTVDTKFFKTETEKLRSENPKDEKFRFLYIGYLSERKNVKRLLSAMKTLSVEKKEFLLDIIGDGEDKPKLENFVKEQSLTDFVRFHGFKQKEELPVFLAQSNCFLFQTDFDIWGLVLNEAMAAGLTCMSTLNAGATIDLIKNGETGFVINFENENEVVKKLKWMIENPMELKMIGKKASDFISKNASLEKSAEGFINAILSVKK